MELLFDSLREAISLLLHLNQYVIDVIVLSLKISGIAVLVGLLIGVPAGLVLGLTRFRGRSSVMALVYTGMGFPPVVIGLFVYMMLARGGPLGFLELLYTPPAMVIAQVILATPYITAIVTSAVASVPREYRLQAMGLGASRLQSIWMIVKEARLTFLTAVMAGFGAVISEVGAVMMVGGNIATTNGNETRVMTTAIVLETRKGNFEAAMAFGLILLGIAVLVVMPLTRFQEGTGGRWLQS